MNRFDKKVELRLPDSLKWSGVNRLFKGEDLLPLWVADMDFEAPAPVLEAIRRRVDAGLFTYTELPPSLFEAVAGWLDRRFNWPVAPSDLLFASGVVTLLKASVLAFTQPGDSVVVQPPVYGPFGDAVTGQGRELVLNPLKIEQGKYKMDFDDLEAKLRLTGAKLLLLCSPHNPAGRVWEEAELNRLAALCQAYGVTVASDEIHSDLILSGQHIPIASLPGMAERTVTFIAPSKTFNLAGLHTSFAVATDETLRIGLDQALGYRSPNPLSIAGAEAAYREGEEWLEACLAYLRGNVSFAADYLAELLPDAVVYVPEATYLLWVDLRAYGLSQEELGRLLVQEARVAVSGGGAFVSEGEGRIRINLATRRENLEEGLSRIARALGSVQPGGEAGIDGAEAGEA
ncbi:MalY/PatB family protein [Cohnella hashimotonis]|uniref:cysteine-S-conjugate beta-lyase n=1 Tax=Cohnella hashimotonis TaxID=2826895 RepID=A0ABT6TLX4_9BACL|nr:PatB family C-S lyase [Cohnella hashimotonis]MDI4646812.1 PatB family C-S lyase [Cohnella hashimotonis]